MTSGEGHARFEEAISLRLAGELGDAERVELDAHLAACARCAALGDTLARTNDLLRALPAPLPDARAWAAMKSRARRARVARLWLAAVAAILIAVLIPTSLFLTLSQRNSGGAGWDVAASGFDTDL